MKKGEMKNVQNQIISASTPYLNTKREGIKKIINIRSIKIKMLIVTSTSFNGSSEVIAFTNVLSDEIIMPNRTIANVSKRKIFIIFSGLKCDDKSFTSTTIGFNAYTNNNMARNIDSITHSNGLDEK